MCPALLARRIYSHKQDGAIASQTQQTNIPHSLLCIGAVPPWTPGHTLSMYTSSLIEVTDDAHL